MHKKKELNCYKQEQGNFSSCDHENCKRWEKSGYRQT